MDKKIEKDLENLGNMYRQIEIPVELDQTINAAINRGKVVTNRRIQSKKVWSYGCNITKLD